MKSLGLFLEVDEETVVWWGLYKVRDDDSRLIWSGRYDGDYDYVEDDEYEKNEKSESDERWLMDEALSIHLSIYLSSLTVDA